MKNAELLTVTLTPSPADKMGPRLPETDREARAQGVSDSAQAPS